MKISLKKIKSLVFLSIALSLCLFGFDFSTFAENVNINLNYGINKVAKKGSELPIELSVENRDTQDFKGYLTINVYENNYSVFVYRIDVDISARSTSVYNRTISITNTSNTVIINLYNRKEELVANERTNIDLSFYNENLIIGIISSEYNTLSYLDNLLLTNSTIQTKIVPIDVEKIKDNKNYLDTIDMLIISDYDVDSLDYLNDSLYSLINNSKPIFVGLGKEYGDKSIPSFIHNVDSAKKVNNISLGVNVNKLHLDGGIVVIVSDSFTDIGKLRDADKKFVELLEKCVDEQWILKLSNNYNSYVNNDYYNIGNILNIVDKKKLPDIFIITVLLVFYITFLTIIIYVFLRNINMREQYGKYAVAFSIVYTILMVSIGYSVMKKNTFLTYISIVNIKDANTKETAFLNFRTSENGNYSFDTSTRIKLNPVLQNNREPIVGYNFMDSKLIKSTIFYEEGDRKIISVENAKDFDSNIFVYENSNYLNDIYNLDCSFRRFDGEITGRITNKMNITIKNASILLFGKIVQIGDIEPNRSISLSRATNIGAPIGNNLMISDIISDDSNRNIIKYYLDDNVLGYYDYGLLFGFIDNNGTIDINSGDVGDVYGRTLLVTKINKEASLDIVDSCLLENNVNTVEGYYDYDTNTINGDMEVVNEYSLEEMNDVSKIYFERIDNYDHGALESYVPFYGEILAFNYTTNNYEEIQNNAIDSNKISNYLMPNKHIIIKYNPLSRDPLYRKISLPVPRAIAKK